MSDKPVISLPDHEVKANQRKEFPSCALGTIVLAGEMDIGSMESYVRTLHLVECPECDGTGKTIRPPDEGLINALEKRGIPTSLIEKVKDECQTCSGKGKVLIRESEFNIYEPK